MSPRQTVSRFRYHGVAIALHWMIAVYVILMLALGKYLVSLDESEPLRFVLTQWHKSFGVVAMGLILIRVYWRVIHSPPPLPDHMHVWERRLAATTHGVLYVLLLALPLSGWIMVSTSPLELPTVLFNSIPWPHLPINGSSQVFETAVTVHALAGSILIALLIAHIAAAARHHFLLQDGVTARMNPKFNEYSWASGFIPTVVVISLLTISVNILGFSNRKNVPLALGNEKITFSFTVQRQLVVGVFSEASVAMRLDPQAHEGHELKAEVHTRSATTGNSQIDSTLMGGDWFDAETHPLASFASTEMKRVSGNAFEVIGILTIRGISKELQFPMTLDEAGGRRSGRGTFTVSRMEFDVGRQSQPDDSVVDFPVQVSFEFEIQ